MRLCASGSIAGIEPNQPGAALPVRQLRPHLLPFEHRLTHRVDRLLVGQPLGGPGHRAQHDLARRLALDAQHLGEDVGCFL
jgi:hypothetical protein